MFNYCLIVFDNNLDWFRPMKTLLMDFPTEMQLKLFLLFFLLICLFIINLFICIVYTCIYVCFYQFVYLFMNDTIHLLIKECILFILRETISSIWFGLSVKDLKDRLSCWPCSANRSLLLYCYSHSPAPSHPRRI